MGLAGACACMALGTWWHNRQLIWSCVLHSLRSFETLAFPSLYCFQFLLFPVVAVPEEMPKSCGGAKRRAARVAAAVVRSQQSAQYPPNHNAPGRGAATPVRGRWSTQQPSALADPPALDITPPGGAGRRMCMNGFGHLMAQQPI